MAASTSKTTSAWTPTTYTFWLDSTWRLGRRHRVKLGFTRFSRKTEVHVLDREFTWEGDVYSAGLSASSELTTQTWSGYYRFALIARERVEAGPALGVGWVHINARIKAAGAFAKPGGDVDQINLDQQAGLGHVTGDVGAYFSVWLAKRVALRGDFLYIMVSPGDSTASVADSRLGLDVYPWKHVGLGAQFKYNKFRYDRQLGAAGLGGAVAYHGVQLYVSGLF